MLNFLLSPVDLASTAIAIAVFAAVISTYLRPGRAVIFKDGFLPVSDWRPTGHIDFINSERRDDPSKPMPLFLLRVEEYRIIESTAVSAAKQVEYRWRNAALDEAKRVVWHHNSTHRTIDDYLPNIIRNPHALPETANTTSSKPTIELKPISSTTNSRRTA
jgi:hypothetical protein